MKPLFFYCFTYLGLVLALFSQTAAAQADEPENGFKSIFDGKTLQGWQVTPEKFKQAWTVEEGAIVGNGDRGRCYLEYHQKSIANFELKFSYQFPGKGNSGVSIRARPDPTGKRHYQSYHADLGHVGIGKNILGAWDFHTPGRREHACFRGDRLVIDVNDQPTITKIPGAVTLADIKKNGWNQVHVTANDNHFKFSINGKMSAEFIEHLQPEKRLDQGTLQLQLHDPGMVVKFKDIRLKILK